MRVESQCAHSGSPLTLEIDSDLWVEVISPGGDPVVFVPDINLSTLKEDSIVEAF